jgi:hypothetical protein
LVKCAAVDVDELLFFLLWILFRLFAINVGISITGCLSALPVGGLVDVKAPQVALFHLGQEPSKDVELLGNPKYGGEYWLYDEEFNEQLDFLRVELPHHAGACHTAMQDEYPAAQLPGVDSRQLGILAPARLLEQAFVHGIPLDVDR